MSILSNNTMLNMSITIEELNNKHQLNPDNLGTKPIDQCMCIVNDELGICAIYGIYRSGQEYEWEVQWEGGKAYICADTYVMKSNGEFGNIQSFTLNPADAIVIIKENGEKAVSRILKIRCTFNYNSAFKIVSQRHNYVLSSGIVVQSD